MIVQRQFLKCMGVLVRQLTGNGGRFGFLLSQTYKFSPGYKCWTAEKISRAFSFERCQVQVGGVCFSCFGHAMYVLVMSRKQCPR